MTGVPEEERRRGPRAFLLAVATLWLPTLLPLLFGPAHHCWRCARLYVGLMWCPLAPPILLALGPAPSAIVAAALASLLLLALLTWALWRLPHPVAWSLQLLVLVVVAFGSFWWALIVEVAHC